MTAAPPTTTMATTTLVLGHGSFFAEGDIAFPDSNYIRCSPIDKRAWLDAPHISVDIDPEMRPDIVYDLRVLPWAFAADNAYDRIVDTCGLGLERMYRNRAFVAELDRVLAPGGSFFGRRGFVHSLGG